MRKKPGGNPGRSRTVTLTPIPEPSCRVCGDRKTVSVVSYAHTDDPPWLAKCPHCGPPYAPISTYHRQG